MTNKPVIIHLIKSLNPGGCEYMLLRTLPLLQKYSHYIFTLGPAGYLVNKFKAKGISVVSSTSLLDLLKQIRFLKPRIIITYLFHADLIGGLLIKPITGFKIIPFLRSTYNSFKYLPALLSAWITKPLTTEYLANSEAVKNYYINHLHVSKDKITVITNGINLEDINNIKTKPKTGNKIICVANFHPNKGHSLLLTAFEESFRTHARASLTLVGEGETKTKLIEQIKNYKSRSKIIFTGYRADVISLLNQADIYVLPTKFEGMSNAILEAMACGLPVITSDIPENRELIISGENGLLHNSDDVNDLVQKVNLLLDDSKFRNKLGKAAKRTIITKYNLNLIVRQWDYYLSNQI